MRIKALKGRDIPQDIIEKVIDLISEPNLERPDGTPCYCNPDIPNMAEDFATDSMLGVCDGESQEVENHSIAAALSAIARAQMLLGIADYKRKTKGPTNDIRCLH
jgi:hypothetical protein